MSPTIFGIITINCINDDNSLSDSRTIRFEYGHNSNCARIHIFPLHFPRMNTLAG